MPFFCGVAESKLICQPEVSRRTIHPASVNRVSMKTSLRIFVCGSLALLLVIAVVVGCWRPGLMRAEPNHGHQLGGDLLDLPGNTIEAFEIGIREHEASSEWKYAECDIRETGDNRLVVFHDWDLSSVPNTEVNQAVLGETVGDQPVNKLTLEQLQSLQLQGGTRIPTLEEVLQTAVRIQPVKPILLEIKLLHSDEARFHMLDLAKRYRDQHGLEIQFLAFIRNVSRSFDDPRQWLDRFSDAGFRVYQTYRPKTQEYDLCDTWGD